MADMAMENGGNPITPVGNGEKTIRVLLVDDSLVALTLLKRMLAVSPAIQVVGTARNGKEALELIPLLDPHVICTDLHMPVMNGLELTRAVMDRYPRPILVVSVSVNTEKPHNIFELLGAGAVDVFPKPRIAEEAEYLKHASGLAQAVRILAGVRVFRRLAPKAAKVAVAIPPAEGVPAPRIVGIGASTGGPPVLRTILSALPRDYGLPVICVQHISEGFLDGLIEWLRPFCALKVETALAGDLPRPGVVYFPREGQHLTLDAEGRFSYHLGAAGDSHCPSISALFNSLAARHGAGVLGVLLTGMGNDGADGMASIARAGGITVAQDEATCVVAGLPKSAIELNAAGNVLSPDGIAEFLISRAAIMKGI